MAIDTSIYQSLGNIRPVETPSYLDTASKAMGLSRLAMQNKQDMQSQQDQDAVRGAFSKNIGPDGQVNRQGVLSDLAKTSPMQAMDYRSKFTQMDAAQADQQKKVLQDNMDKFSTAYRMASTATDQTSYDQMKQQMQAMGLPIDHLPPQFDPAHIGDLKSKAAMMTMDAKQGLDAIKGMSEVGINQAKAPLERGKLGAEIGHLNAETSKLRTEAGQADPAKTVRGPEAVSLGQASAAVKELDDYQKTLDSVNDISGRGAGSILAGIQGKLQMGEDGRRAAAVDATADKVTQVMGSYLQHGVLDKATFERYKEMLPSRYDAPEVRASKLQTVKNLIAQRQNEELKALQQTGYDVSQVPALEGPGHLEVPRGQGGRSTADTTSERRQTGSGIIQSANAANIQPTPAGMILMRSPSGKVKYVPVSQKGEAIAAGGEVVR